MRRSLIVLSVAAIMVLLLVTAEPALAQQTLPKSGGPLPSPITLSSIILPVTALLLGLGLVGYVIGRRGR